MFTHWNDFDHTFSLFGDFRNQLDRAWNERDARLARASAPTQGTPAIRVHDTESAIVLTADVPGLRETDVSVTFHEGVLTIAGERKNTLPDGFQAVRQERASYKFSQSFSISTRVDAEHANATVKAGVLTVELPKVAEAKPRQIAVRSLA